MNPAQARASGSAIWRARIARPQEGSIWPLRPDLANAVDVAIARHIHYLRSGFKKGPEFSVTLPVGIRLVRLRSSSEG